ncbi:MAG: amidoligase family protein [Candidatus Riflebacteria bacterium]|nr:amidoligase family protein [Candidatus Riflebacteria bacterium]
MTLAAGAFRGRKEKSVACAIAGWYSRVVTSDRGQRFGVEVELVGLERETVAAVLASQVGGEVLEASEGRFLVEQADGRQWRVEPDDSLGLWEPWAAEVVSPVLEVEDLEVLGPVVDALAQAGGTTSPDCGVHVHLDAADYSPEVLCRFVQEVIGIEPYMSLAFDISESRLADFTRLLDERFVREFRANPPRSREELLKQWYGASESIEQARLERYHRSRYRGLNLHSLAYRGTIEFRYFNSTLDAPTLRRYILFCLLVAERSRQLDEAGVR